MQDFLCSTFYLWGTLLLVPLWLLIYIKQPSVNTRREMFYAGVIFGIGALTIDFFYATGDYWRPTYIFGRWFPIEDFLYGFVFGGVIVEFYELLFAKEVYSQLKKQYVVTIACFIFTVVGYYVFISIFKINSVTTTIIIALVVGICTVIVRRDLLLPAIISGLLITVMQIVWYWIILLICPVVFVNYWKISNLSGIMFLKIPLEEIIYAFAIGFGAAHFYEMFTGKQMKFKKII